MSRTRWIAIVPILFVIVSLSACSGGLSSLAAELTPIPSLAPGSTATLVTAIEQPENNVSTLVTNSGEVSAAIGAAVYLKNCTSCHGIQGQGVDAPPLRNNQFIQTSGDQAIVDTIANGRPDTEMPAWFSNNGGPLSKLEINDVLAYLHTLQGVASIPPNPTPTPEPTEAPAAPGGPTPEPAQPSEAGGPGPAATMAGDSAQGKVDFGLYCAACHGPEGIQGVPNPGSDDGSVPELNPIDPTLVNANPNIFAVNVDLFIEHGSVPSGSNPTILMPSFGDSHLLTEQQIADLIAYIISINNGN